MPRMVFEPTIPAFELAKTVHALDRAATVIGDNIYEPTLLQKIVVYCGWYCWWGVEACLDSAAYTVMMFSENFIKNILLFNQVSNIVSRTILRSLGNLRFFQ
jgi:hypothetical protein